MKKSQTTATRTTTKKATKKVARPLLGHGVGRRKESVARVWLRLGKGIVNINGRSFEQYFPTEETRSAAVSPLVLTKLGSGYDVDANVHGGGTTGQAGAVKLGIARALLANDDALRPILRRNGMLTRDDRMVERKKPGQRGARRKFQFVKR